MKFLGLYPSYTFQICREDSYQKSRLWSLYLPYFKCSAKTAILCNLIVTFENSFVAPYTKFGFVNWVDNVIGNRKEFQSELIIRPDEGLTLKPNYVVMLPRRRSTTAFRNLPPIYEIVGYRKGRRDKRFRTCRVFYVFYRNDGELHSKLYDWMFIWFVNFAFIFFWNCTICNILTIPGTSKTQIPRLFSHT